MSRQSFVDAHESHRLRRESRTCHGCHTTITPEDLIDQINGRPAHAECAESWAEEDQMCDCRWSSDPYCTYHGFL